MSMGPLGMIGAAAGSPLAQGKGSDVDKVQQETAGQARQVQMDEKAEQADGVGQTEQDEQATDRDADGRRPWERAPNGSKEGTDDASASIEGHDRCSTDPTGQSGRQVDLSG
jgi:hypothetical protein